MDESLREARLDRWLWAVRLCKTRSQAAEACRAGKARVDGDRAKPSRLVRGGETVRLQQGPVQRIARVRAPLEKRVGPKRVEDYMEDLTPPEEFERRRLTAAQAVLKRDPGAGRPTKRDRRAIDRLLGD